MKPTFSILCAALATTGISSAALVISSTAPSGDILSSLNTGTTFSRIIDEDVNANHARGQLFSLGAAGGTNTGFEITAVTLHKNGNQTFANDTMTLRIFEGTSAQWGTGTGHSTATDGSDFYVDTGVTPLYTESFTVNGLISGGNYVTFQLTTPITVAENSDFGFFFVYEESAASSPDYFQYNENTSGGRTAISTTAHAIPGSRGMRNLVQGTAIPEPGSLALLGLGSLGLLARRRK